MKQAVRQAIERAGGSLALARELGISRQAVDQWLEPNRMLPAERVLEIEELTGISRYRLRPDIYGPRPRAGRRGTSNAAA